ncbi:MAG TPA: amidohydrolase family protein, partial [Gemmatimonadaceae bacterium]|nr:amidohydrolase family protein [Gemmatimonadaceae bacterium]
VGDVLARWSRGGIGTNAALYVGHGSVRAAVLGARSRAPSPAELRRMESLVDRAMREGALGLSSGLYYTPGSFATTDEVIALARVAGTRGGVYDTHLRDESSYNVGLLGAVDEALRIGREGRIPVHLSHIKALGTDAWGKADTVVAHVREAIANGLEVTADQYPYTASGTAIGAALLPTWAEAGGRDSLRARAADPTTRARLLADMRENLRRRGGAEAMLITGSRIAGIAGRRLSDIARDRGGEPAAVALDLILAGDADVASFNMREEDIRRFMREEWVMTGSDGSDGHPRKYGTYPRLLRQYVFGADPAMSLERAVRRSSSLPAKALHLGDRGELRVGARADVIVFDSATVADRATYEAPTRLATGMRWVVVNGRVAVRDGKPTGVLAGRGLRRGGAPAPPR